MICIAHRGARGHEPENTLLAFERAIELGAHWIELDVHALDGELLVIHDDRLERTTNGQGLLAEQSLAYVRSLDAGKGERVPTLMEVFELAVGRICINIELKGAATAALVAQRVDEYLADGWDREQVIVSSFDHRELAKMREMAPHVQLGALLVGLPVDDAAFAQALGAHSVHPSVDFVDERFVNDAHKRGLKVFPFTANHPADIARMSALGVDGVFTDYPERVVA